jgi:hypothetical protein
METEFLEVVRATNPGIKKAGRRYQTYPGSEESTYHPKVRNASRLPLLLLMICNVVHALQQGTDSAESATERDVYAIYSLILANVQTSHGPDDNARYLIAATTVPGFPKEPCVRPPREREADFREVLLDYEQRKATPRELKPHFSVHKPYVLLSANEIKEFTKQRTSFPTAETPSDPRFQGVTDLFRLSDVYFNRSRTLALTAISSWCGMLCGSSRWKVFDKLDTGKWVERHWVTCGAMARNDSAFSEPGHTSPKIAYGSSVVVVGETGKQAAERWATWIADPKDIEATLASCIPS